MSKPHSTSDSPKRTFLQKCRTIRGKQMICTVVFLFVPLLLLFTFTYLPFFKMVQFSFFDRDYLRVRSFVGLRNYLDVFSRSDCFQALKLSLYYMVGSVVQIALALLFATVLSFKVRGSRFFRGALYFPCLICGIAVGFIFKFFLNPGFVLDTLLSWVGITNTPNWLENPFVPFNRNAVLFPRKIGGMYTMLSRPSDSGHTPFGDIFLSQSPDLEFWGRHRHIMGKSGNWWENLKIGGGAAPIETDEGWLLFYHGVTGTCNGYVYSIGGAILDREEPSRVLYRCRDFLLTPEEWYEERGFVPNVCFPCAALADGETGRIALYYGCADSYVGLAFTTADEIVAYIKENSETSDADREAGRR